MADPWESPGLGRNGPAVFLINPLGRPQGRYMIRGGGRLSGRPGWYPIQPASQQSQPASFLCSFSQPGPHIGRPQSRQWRWIYQQHNTVLLINYISILSTSSNGAMWCCGHFKLHTRIHGYFSPLHPLLVGNVNMQSVHLKMIGESNSCL